MKPGRCTLMVLPICLAAFSLAASVDELNRSPRSHDLKRDSQSRPGTDRRVRPIGPVDPSASLKALEDCEDLRSYFVDVTVETVLEHRYYRWYFVPWASPGGGREVADGPSDYTTTNNQEMGVDEIDIVKTDGTHLYVTEHDTLHVLQSWPAQATAEVAAAPTGSPSWGLFLHTKRAVTVSSIYEPEGDFPRSAGAVRLEVFDIADPSAPVSIRTVDVEGGLVDARLIDGDLYAVIRTYIDYPPEVWALTWRDDLGLPDYPWDADDEERERVLDEARAILRPLVEEIVAGHAVDDFLPRVRDRNRSDPDAPSRGLLDCDSLYRPATASDWAVLSVVHLDLDDDGPVTATGLIADGWTVYASAASLYVAQTSDWWWWGRLWRPTEMTTVIHKFELDPTQSNPVRYAASGVVDGWILDQFALSEHDSYLRVATTQFDWWWGTTPNEEQASSVTVLTDDGAGNLREVGRVGGLGPGERIFAVRFMGARGYVVTFRQIDPLYTLDLSNPFLPQGRRRARGDGVFVLPPPDRRRLAAGGGSGSRRTEAG